MIVYFNYAGGSGKFNSPSIELQSMLGNVSDINTVFLADWPSNISSLNRVSKKEMKSYKTK